MVKNVYTNRATDEMLEELQKDPKFVLSKFFETAVKQYYETSTHKTNELELQAKEVLARKEQAERELQVIQDKIVTEKTSKIKEEEAKRREEEESYNNYKSYALKKIPQFFDIIPAEINKLATEYAELVSEIGAMKAPPIIEFVESKGYRSFK